MSCAIDHELVLANLHCIFALRYQKQGHQPIAQLHIGQLGQAQHHPHIEGIQDLAV
jgi:hypothetical protein